LTLHPDDVSSREDFPQNAQLLEFKCVEFVEILVEGYRAKDASNRANGREVTLADGSKLFLGSSGTGAPEDGRDPGERR
jgi:hypothetical protein